ncbi:hypothetical protein KLP40_17985 [Hymenobacter sp. NST-14]|uniref:HD domain-containing protein n=1 Tax=Hymenobacter piscis TaxID=2839984 RepID=UPI001C010772|nr:hypothetical protein [Hymenobacter piscis]MBT9395062.1 hypothetical protein [Hymenobacter piscis]
MKGVEWQDYIEDLLHIKYSTDYQKVPDKTHGDHGIEGFSTDGKAYQCYSADGNDNLYEKQRDKITQDIKKLIENQKELQKVFGNTIIHYWVLVVPYFNDKGLIKHATKKAQEIRQLSLKFIADDFKIIIATDNSFWTERQIALKQQSPTAKPTHPWASILYENPFYQGLDEIEKEQLAFFAHKSWEFVITSLPEDYANTPWFKTNNLNHLSTSFLKICGEHNFNNYELSVFYTISILKEIIIVSGIHNSTNEFDPISFESTELGGIWRNNYDYSLQKYSRFKRKIQSFIIEEKQSEAKAVAYWLLRKSIINTPKAWKSIEEDGLFDYNLDFKKHFPEPNTEFINTLLKIDFSVFVSYFFKEAYAFNKDEEGVVKDKKILKGTSGNNITINEALLAAVLSIAERMSFDIANLNEVIVDYLGVDQDLSVDAIASSINELFWERDNELCEVHITTTHPAIDFAIRHQIDLLNNHCNLLNIFLKKFYPGSFHNFTLPLFSSEKIEIEKDRKGKNLFEVPHLSFRLSESEVKELLIGGSIYGSQHVFIRELYQNALDACRYRRSRLQYLAQTSNSSQNTWQGEIVFRKGEENGRTYIECSDNGVGMGIKEIRNSFTKAGKRYTDQKEYNEEKFLWSQTSPKIEDFPNSQFGIGVFSYFLMSDKIIVKTKRMDRYGELKQPIELTIEGSGNLCRVRTIADEPTLEKGGTIIRIYLHPTKEVSLIHSLYNWLYISEFRTSIVEDKKEETWHPNQINLGANYSGDLALETDNEGVYLLVRGRQNSNSLHYHQGISLQDGIQVTSLSQPFIINSRNGDKQRLSISRNSYLNQNKYNELVLSRIKGAVNFKCLDTLHSNSNLLSHYHLSFLSSYYPKLVDDFIRITIAKRASIILPLDNIEKKLTTDINQIGVWPMDYKIIFLINQHSETDKFTIRHELYQNFHQTIVDSRINLFEGIILNKHVDENSPFIQHKFAAHDYDILNSVYYLQTSTPLDEWIFPIITVYNNSKSLNISPEELGEIINRFHVFGFPSTKHDFKNPLVLKEKLDEKILSTKLVTYRGWIAGTTDLKHVFAKSYELKMTLGKVISSLKNYQNYNISLPEIQEYLFDYYVTEFDLFTIGYHPDKYIHTNYAGNITTQLITSIAIQAKTQPSEILDRFRFLQPQLRNSFDPFVDIVREFEIDFENNNAFVIKNQESIVHYLTFRTYANRSVG